MKNGTPRQAYLYLASRLCELASEFSDEELRAVVKVSSGADSAIGRAVRALSGLHDELQKNSNLELAIPSVPQPSQIEAPFVTAGGGSGDMSRALYQLFMDETIFPRVTDVANFLAMDAKGKVVLQPKSKESRERFVRRAVGYYRNLPESGKTEILDRIKSSGKIARGFVNRWTSAIKDL